MSSDCRSGGKTFIKGRNCPEIPIFQQKRLRNRSNEPFFWDLLLYQGSGCSGYIEDFIHNEEDNQGCLKFPVFDSYSQQAHNNRNEDAGIVFRTGMGKVLSSLDQRIYYIEQETETQEGIKPVFSGIEV